jgi:hypothetical protein
VVEYVVVVGSGLVEGELDGGVVGEGRVQHKRRKIKVGRDWSKLVVFKIDGEESQKLRLKL